MAFGQSKTVTLFLALLCLSVESRAESARLNAQLVPHSGEKEMAGFQVTDAGQFPIRVRSAKSPGDRFSGEYVVLSGSFDRPGWALLVGSTTLKPDSRHRFAVSILLKGQITPIVFSAVGPGGQVEYRHYELHKISSALQIHAGQKPISKRLGFSVGLAYTEISYNESAVTPFSETALTAKASVDYALVPGKVPIGASAFGTVLPLSSTVSGVSARFLGGNIRIGWILPFVGNPWSVALMGGAYYTTTFPQGASFGFGDMVGPQAFLTVSRTLAPKWKVNTYGKYAAIGSSFGFTGFENREIAAGFSVSRLLTGGRTLSFTFDASDLSLSVSGISIQLDTLNAGLSIGL